MIEIRGVTKMNVKLTLGESILMENEYGNRLSNRHFFLHSVKENCYIKQQLNDIYLALV
jgi:hypothetical protein